MGVKAKLIGNVEIRIDDPRYFSGIARAVVRDRGMIDGYLRGTRLYRPLGGVFRGFVGRAYYRP
jgi:hypothetical protein